MFKSLTEDLQNIFNHEKDDSIFLINKIQNAFYDFDIFHLESKNIYKNIKLISKNKIKTLIDEDRDEVTLKFENFSIHYYLSSLPILYKDYIFNFNNIYIRIKTDSMNNYKIYKIYFGDKINDKKYFVYDVFKQKAFTTHKPDSIEISNYTYLMNNIFDNHIEDFMLLQNDLNFKDILFAIKNFLELINN